MLANALTSNAKLPPMKYNDKMLDALAWIAQDEDFYDATLDMVLSETRFFCMEGTIRSTKTVDAVEGFHLRVQKQKGKFALIAAKDYDAINDNILNAERGLFTLYPGQYKLEKDKIGGYYVSVVGTDKKILLAGYSDAAKWKKILGKDIETILIDEINIADELFVEECFARQSATEHPIMICTLNGDDPQHKIYQNRINKCLVIGECPASIRAEMDAQKVKKRGYYYMHFTFENHPALKPMQKRNLRTLYPIGSYYHKIKVLGERGKWGKMIFADYMSPDLLVDIYEKLPNGSPKFPMHEHTIGIDIAENRATNVIAWLGFAKDFSWAAVIDLEVFKSEQNGKKVGYHYKTQRIKATLVNHTDIIKNTTGGFVDSAEGNYINDLKTEKLGIPIAGSYKATIKQRCDLVIILTNAKRLFFHAPKCTAAYNAYMAATWVKGKEGKEREDNNLPMNDIMDGIEYGLTRHMNKLLLAAKRGVN